MQPKGRPKISSITVPNPQQALVRLLNSTPDFAATVDFIRRARQYRRSTVEHVALLLGALISYSRPFKDHAGCALGQIPVFAALATDLGADLQLHAGIVRLSIQALASQYPSHPFALPEIPELFGDLAENARFRAAYETILHRLHEIGAARTIEELNAGTLP